MASKHRLRLATGDHEIEVEPSADGTYEVCVSED
jgi:hypothetical protein